MRFNFDRHSTSNTVSLNQLTFHQWMTVGNYRNSAMSGVFDQCAGTLRAVIGQSEPCTNLIWLPPAPRRLLVVVRF